MQSQLKSLLSPEGADELDHRARLIEAMADALSEQAYSAITIADVVRRARVSKRTFYEHFQDKEDCYLATYAVVSEGVLREIAQAAVRGRDAEQRLRLALRAYVGSLEASPRITHSFLSEIQGAGPRALAARRRVHQQFAQHMRALVEAGRHEEPNARGLSPAMATAIVGGINELLLETLEAGSSDLRPVENTAFSLIRAILLAPPETDEGSR